MFKMLLGGKLTETLLTDLNEVLFYPQAFGIWYLEARVILVHNVLHNELCTDSCNILDKGTFSKG